MSLASQNPSFEHYQRVIIPNKSGEKLVGILHESSGTTTNDIVILCHGFRCSKDINLILNLAAALEKEQISSFRFDFSGNGESEGSFEYGNHWKEVDDLHAVAQHFRESNRVIRAIVGHSKGGDVVLLYASKYHELKTVVNLSGRYDLKAGIEERLGKDYLERIRKDGFFDVKRSSGKLDYRVTEESLMDRLGTNMHEACLQIDKDCRSLQFMVLLTKLSRFKMHMSLLRSYQITSYISLKS
uniref:Serine aminopeptidase S33 domain-containing protein n=1 Tax=Medicago truncatula TaxID=3880 RepID=B7FKI0_MEDTR|nr:unknown [Medicago truncatula]